MTQLTDKLIRKNLKNLKPYESARRLFSMADASEIETTWLNANENPFVPQVSINPALFNRYPDFQPEPLVKNYANYAGLPQSKVLATRGADEGIELLIRTFCEIGDKVLICPPTYGMYAISAETCGVEVSQVVTDEQFQLNIPEIKAQLEQVKLVFICSPNNPTGQTIDRAKLIEIIEAASDKCLVIADEAYIEFCPQASVSDLISKYKNLVVLRTLSKAFGLAGLRCGFTLADDSVIDCLKKVIAPYPIPAPVAQIATQALSVEGISWMQTKVSELNRLRGAFIAEAEQWSIIEKVYPSETNFVLLKLRSSISAQDLVATFLANNILLRDQSKQINLSNTVRVSIGDTAQMQKVTALFEQLNKNL